MTTATVYVLVSCLPERGEAKPTIPDVFTDKAAAEAKADEYLRAEWAANGPEDDETGERLPYPGDWREAESVIAEANEDSDTPWGRWELTEHTVTLA